MSKPTKNESMNAKPVMEASPAPAPAPAPAPKPQFDFDELFTYHPPTEEQAPKYQQLQLGFLAVLEAGKVVLKGQRGDERAPQADFEAFTRSVRAYAELIAELCPSSADRTAAIRCLRLARNAMNDVLCGNRNHPHGLDPDPFSAIFEQELIKARYQANASIALNGRG